MPKGPSLLPIFCASQPTPKSPWFLWFWPCFPLPHLLHFSLGWHTLTAFGLNGSPEWAKGNGGDKPNTSAMAAGKKGFLGGGKSRHCKFGQRPPQKRTRTGQLQHFSPFGQSPNKAHSFIVRSFHPHPFYPFAPVASIHFVLPSSRPSCPFTFTTTFPLTFLILLFVPSGQTLKRAKGKLTKSKSIHFPQFLRLFIPNWPPSQNALIAAHSWALEVSNATVGFSID